MRRTWTGSYSCSEEEEKGIGYFFSEMRGRAQGARILTIIDGCMKAPLIPKAPTVRAVVVESIETRRVESKSRRSAIERNATDHSWSEAAVQTSEKTLIPR